MQNCWQPLGVAEADMIRDGLARQPIYKNMIAMRLTARGSAE